MLPAALREHYGDIVRLPRNVILLSHPDHIAHVNLREPGRYDRAELVRQPMKVQGQPHHATFFDPDDDAWQRGRKLMQPHFTQKGLTDLGHRFTAAITDEVDKWGAVDGPVEMHDRLKELALAVLYNTMFSRRVEPELMPLLLAALDARMNATTARTLMFFLPGLVPRPLDARGARADAWLDAHLADIIAERRAHPIEAMDLLNALLAAKYEDGAPVEDERTRIEMLFLVIGGHETTAAAMLWTFARLAQRPDIAEQVYAEVDALGGNAVGPQDMAKLDFTRACFDEAQRLQGGLIINPKRAVEEDEIGGYRIPVGATVLHSNYTLQRDTRFWGPDASDYRPGRWFEGVDNAAFLNFGRGRRMCLGKRMAYIEAVLTLATAFQRYRFALTPGEPLRNEYRMSMGIKGGLPLITTPRRGTA
jgi:cytochrome P450